MPTGSGTYADPYLISGATGSETVPDGHDPVIYKWVGTTADAHKWTGVSVTVPPSTAQATWTVYDATDGTTGNTSSDVSTNSYPGYGFVAAAGAFYIQLDGPETTRVLTWNVAVSWTFSQPHPISGDTGSVTLPDDTVAYYAVCKWVGSTSDFTRPMGVLLDDGSGNTNAAWSAYDEKAPSTESGIRGLGSSTSTADARVPFDGNFYVQAGTPGTSGVARVLSWSLGTALPARPYVWQDPVDITAAANAGTAVVFDNVGPSYDQRNYTILGVTAGKTITLDPALFEAADYGEIYDITTDPTTPFGTYLDDFYLNGTSPAKTGIVSVPSTGGPYDYQVVVYPGGPDDGTTWSFRPAIAAAEPPPAYVVTNDDFATPIALADPAHAGSITYDNTGATEDADPYSVYGILKERSIWYSFTPSASGIVTYTATPSDSDPARIASVDIYTYDATTSTWQDRGTGTGTSLSGTYGSYPSSQIAAVSGTSYRVVLCFTDGIAGRWETAGHLAWTFAATPANVDVASSATLPQASSFTLPAYAGSQVYYFTMTVPVDGGFMIALGDGTAAVPSGSHPSGSASSVSGGGGPDAGSFSWGTGDTTSYRYTRQSVAGDVIYARVSVSNWAGGAIPIRWGVSTDITYTDWISGAWSDIYFAGGATRRTEYWYPDIYFPSHYFSIPNQAYPSWLAPTTRYYNDISYFFDVNSHGAYGSVAPERTRDGITDPTEPFLDNSDAPGFVSAAIAGTGMVPTGYSSYRFGYGGSNLCGPPVGDWSYTSKFEYTRQAIGEECVTREPNYGLNQGVERVAPLLAAGRGLIAGVPAGSGAAYALSRKVIQYRDNAKIQIQWVSSPDDLGYYAPSVSTYSQGPGDLFGPPHVVDMSTAASSAVLYEANPANTPSEEIALWSASSGSVLLEVGPGWVWDGNPITIGPRVDFEPGMVMNYTAGLAMSDQIAGALVINADSALAVLYPRGPGAPFGVSEYQWQSGGSITTHMLPSLWIPDFRVGTYADSYGPANVFRPGYLVDPNPDLNGGPRSVDVNFA